MSSWMFMLSWVKHEKLQTRGPIECQEDWFSCELAHNWALTQQNLSLEFPTKRDGNPFISYRD